MSDNTKLTDLFAALQNDMISKAQFSPALNHPVDKGTNSEENWLKWFTNYLPHRYKTAKATIIDSKDHSFSTTEAAY